MDISNLPGTQLTAFAVLDSTVAQDDVDENVERQTSQKKKIIKLRKWKAQDLPEKTNVPCYPYKPSIADIPRKPSETLELFLDVLAIDHLVKQTVNYAVQNGKHSFALTSDEMKTFIGILLVSGYCCIPRHRLYWQRQPDVYNELIADSMRRDRFDEIMKYFHAADNTKLPKKDKYGKVSPLMEILNGNFLKYGEVFGPINISIDESMIPYFGRYPTKQFIRGKPVRWGHKAWVAADPNGYVFDISVYQGQRWC
ncbi:piggyBac transposable element-derived protein 3-like [Portunus trituberculatus]|uniref:piggyBac transposable element-derived protein 3-like n=1 Tax=Portunus trituberculatus TaxID=210409 RepID=UPI001E1CB507|nr:piggyBac transposable element-derived protein 3-like [Portunus trituberculatus]